MTAKTHIKWTSLPAQIAITLALLICVCIAVQSSLQWGLTAYRIPPSEMIMAPAEKDAIPQKIEALSGHSHAAAQFRPRQIEARRFHFSVQDAALAEVPHAIWIPHLGKDSTLYINNARTRLGQARPKPLLGTGAANIRYDLPRFLILPRRNRFNIYVTEDPSRAGLGPVFLAPAEKVIAAEKRAQWVDNTLPQIGLSLALFGLVLNMLAAALSKSKAVPFGLSLISACITALYYYGGTLPLLCSLGLCILIGAWLTRQKRLGLLMMIFLGLASLGTILALYRGYGFTAHPSPALITPLIWLGAVPLITIPALETISKAIQARRSRVEILKSVLDDTKDDLEREIRKRAILEERERLTRDIHDGVGGQLLGLLLRLRTGELPKETITRDLQDGINDLRLVVDALDQTGNDLGRALAGFKDRADNQLDAAGLTLNWTQQETLNYEPQSRDAVLHLYRLLQEALNNIIRHAQASRVDVDIKIDDAGVLRLAILDNGIGRGQDVKAGHGTLNMQRRADLLGAELKTGRGIDGAGHGIVVKLQKA